MRASGPKKEPPERYKTQRIAAALDQGGMSLGKSSWKYEGLTARQVEDKMMVDESKA